MREEVDSGGPRRWEHIALVSKKERTRARAQAGDDVTDDVGARRARTARQAKVTPMHIAQARELGVNRMEPANCSTDTACALQAFEVNKMYEAGLAPLWAAKVVGP